MHEELKDPRFAPWASGRFMEHWGPQGKGVVSSEKKLCLVATDPKFLIDLLYGLSLRDDCIYVKYGTFVREGKYLGRCFMQTDRAAAKLCQQLKGHGRLMASVQFAPASRFGLRYEHTVRDEAFMALELVAGGLTGSAGVVRYLPGFAART